MAKEDGLEITPKEQRAFMLMLAADDFKLSNVLSTVAKNASSLARNYVLPALKQAFPTYSAGIDMVSNMIQKNESSGMRVQKSIILFNFVLQEDKVLNVNLNPGYDYFGWLSQIANSY